MLLDRKLKLWQYTERLWEELGKQYSNHLPQHFYDFNLQSTNITYNFLHKKAHKNVLINFPIWSRGISENTLEVKSLADLKFGGM